MMIVSVQVGTYGATTDWRVLSCLLVTKSKLFFCCTTEFVCQSLQRSVQGCCNGRQH
eukprot:SAG11_NODE_16989_length_531_cov_3.518519_1_plen_56_part_01